MNSGILATGSTVPQRLEEFDRQETYPDGEFREVLNINQEYQNLSGDTIGYYGIAAVETLVSKEKTTVGENGEIGTTTVDEPTWKHTEFILVPGEFVIIGNSDGKFVADLIGRQADEFIEPAKINLDAYIKEERPEAKAWKFGFFGRDDHADKGTVYGDNLLEDNEVGRVLVDNSVNQIGLRYEKNGRQMKTSLTRSGYVEVYQPDDFDDVDYIQFLRDEVSPYLRVE